MGTYDQLKRIQQRAQQKRDETGSDTPSCMQGETKRNDVRNGTNERDVWREALLLYERNKPLLLGAEDPLPPYRALANECAALADRGVLAMNLAQAVYSTLDTLRTALHEEPARRAESEEARHAAAALVQEEEQVMRGKNADLKALVELIMEMNATQIHVMLLYAQQTAQKALTAP